MNKYTTQEIDAVFKELVNILPDNATNLFEYFTISENDRYDLYCVIEYFEDGKYLTIGRHLTNNHNQKE